MGRTHRQDGSHLHRMDRAIRNVLRQILRGGKSTAEPSLEMLEGRRLLSAIAPAGPEFLVNTHTAGSQQMPAIAMASDGHFLIAWSGAGPGDDSGIFAQLFNSSGQKQGDPFRVNTHTTGTQASPATAIDPSGQFVITWSGVGADDADGVYAQRYDASAQPLGAEFRVNSLSEGKQQSPSVTFTPNVGFVIAWESYAQDGNGYGIYAQRYNPTGQALGSEFRVNVTVNGNQRDPALAADAQGNFVIAWMGQPGVGKPYDVYARRYDANGESQTSEFVVNSTKADTQQSPAVAMNASGAFVVAWESEGQDNPDGKAGIFASSYDPWGQKMIGEFPLNTFTLDEQRLATVALGNEGTFVVAWASSTQDGSALGIYAQCVSAAGQKIGPEFRVNNFIDQDQSNPSMAMDVAGNFTIAWQSDGQDGSGAGIYARRYQYSAQRASIGDFVWSDSDADGIQDPGESGIDGVVVRLYDQANRLITTTTTQSGGWYGFRDLPAATYSLQFVAPAGFIFSPAHRGNDDSLDSDADATTGRTAPFLLASEDSALHFDAGLISWPSIAGIVFNDRNGNGARETSESGLAGWIVYIDSNRNNHLDSSEPSTTTAADGRYVLPGLAPGQHRVARIAQSLWQQTSPPSQYFDVTLTMGQQVTGVDFGHQTALPDSTARAGSLLSVNTTACLEYRTPAAAMDADGDFVLAWAGYRAEDGWFLRAQRYGSTVRKRGSEMQVMQTSRGHLAIDANGAFAVAGQSTSSVAGQRYTADGLTQGDTFLISSDPLNSSRGPAIAMDADGDMVVAWEGISPSGGAGVLVQRYAATGYARGQQLFVPSATNPALAMDAAGNFILVWESQTLDGSTKHLDVYAQRYNVTGNPQGSAFRVNTLAAADQCDPAVAMDAAGNFIIAWSNASSVDSTQDATGWEVFAQRYSAAGEPQGGQFLANTHTPGDQRHPSIAMSLGDFVIAFSGDGPDGRGVYAQRYNAAGVRQGTQLSVSGTLTTSSPSPDVAMDANGNFIVTWIGENAINARRYSVNHAPTTTGLPDITVSPGSASSRVDLFVAFADDKDSDDKLSYAIVGNSNPSLFSSTQIDSTTGQLLLSHAPGAMGSARLTIRATDSGDLSVETTFTVTLARMLQGTDSSDTVYLRLDPTGKNIQVWQNTPVSGEPSFLLPWDGLTELSFDGRGGQDVLTIDQSNGVPIPFGGLIIDGGSITLGRTGGNASTGFGLHLRNNAAVNLASTLRLSALTVANTASLDLADHDLIVTAAPETKQAVLTAISQAIQSARGDGKWAGAGLSSSAAKANKQTGLAVMLNNKNGQAILSSFAGQSVGANDILVKYTWNGDVNLDGQVDAADYFLIDSGYITQEGQYRNGDLNLDGTVDAADYFLVDSAYIAQTGVLAAQ